INIKLIINTKTNRNKYILENVSLSNKDIRSIPMLKEKPTITTTATDNNKLSNFFIISTKNKSIENLKID
ncbi:hypothetical protein, partial [Staphylococcus lutrae]|uniref:hypothetical protein n=1 Tax=Staphylococcus lutrae TaxID=155085 RepID=UPI000CD38F26